MKRFFAGAALIMLPFIFEVGSEDEFRLPKAKAMAFLGLLYLAYELGRKIDIPMGLFCAWVAVSAFFGHGEVQWQDIVLFFGAVVSSFWVARPENWQLLFGFKLFLFSATLVAMYGIVQHFGMDPMINYYEWADIWRPSGLFGQSTLYGPYAVSGFLIALFLNYRVLAAFLLIPIIMIDSSFTYLALMGGIFVYLASKLRLWHLITLSLLSLSLLLPLSFFYSSKIEEAANDKGRIRLWGQSLKLTKQHWLVGHGFGSFKVIYPSFQSQEIRRASGIDDTKLGQGARDFIKVAEQLRAEFGIFYSAHNDLVQVFFELGAVGILLIFIMALSFWRSCRYCMWDKHYPLMVALVVAFCLNAMGSFPFRLVPQVIVPLWIYVIVTSRSAILPRAI